MRLAIAFLALTPLFAGVDGAVINKTTGKPQPGVKVSMTKLGQGGMQAAGSAISGPDGKFRLDSDAASAHLIQAIWQGVTYNVQLPPQTPTSGIEIAIFDALPVLSAVDFTQHMILVETDGKELVVNETVIVSNDSQTTWNDPKSGTLRFTVPAAAGKAIMARVIAPGGMPVEREPKPAGPGAYMVDFPVKPGETRFDISYKIPVTGDAELAGKILHTPGPVRLVVPKGITAEGEGLTPLGNEPRSQAAIFDIKGLSYKVKFTGAGTLNAGQQAAGGEAPAEGAAEEETGASIQQIQPPGYDRAWKYALGLTLGILILSFAALWLKPTPAVRSNTKA
jgi:hypothetical protein